MTNGSPPASSWSTNTGFPKPIFAGLAPFAGTAASRPNATAATASADSAAMRGRLVTRRLLIPPGLHGLCRNRTAISPGVPADPVDRLVDMTSAIDAAIDELWER